MPGGVQPVQATIELFDAFTAPMMRIINAANLGAGAISSIQDVVNANIDPSSMQQMEQSIQDAQAAAERFRESLRGMETPEVSFQWQSADNIEVFNTSGSERWRQEIASAQEMMNRLASSQERITQQAVYGDILPPDAANDMIALNQRISAIGQRIQQISSRPLNTVSESDIAETEQLRMQLNRCLQLQNQMNSATNALDLEAANRAYLQLEQTVGNTERFIRDNISEQENFNNAVRSGQDEADKLTGLIKKAAGAFLSIKGIQKIVDISDEMTSITARLDTMNDGAQSTEELLNMTYAAAERSRGSLSGMASLVARIGNNARDAFSSNAEVIAFSELVQKQMTIAGASTEEASNTMLQLSQALGSGVLRGDELNSIFEQAPNIVQSIADYLGKPIGQIRDMASEGELSASVVKAAIFASADDINTKFDKMPKTWGQVWQSIKNQAVMAMQPVLDKISEMASMEEVQNGISAVMDMLAAAAGFAVEILGVVASVAGFVVDNWSTIEPIILGVAAAFLIYNSYLLITKGTLALVQAAQRLLNSGMLACPALWIALAIGAVAVAIGLYTNSVNEAYGLSLSFAGMLGGSLMTILAGLGNIVIAIANVFIRAFDRIWNFIAAFLNFFANAFTEPVGAVWNLWKSLFTNIMDDVLTVTEMIDGIFKSNLSEKVRGFRDDMINKVEDLYGEEMKKANKVVVEEKDHTLDYINLDEAFEAGYYLGDTLFGGDGNMNSQNNNKNKNDELTEILSKVDELNNSTESINDSLEVSEEDLKYLRDIAEQETVNRFTTAEIIIEQTNHNTVSGGMDLDGIVDGLTEAVEEAASIISEGAYA